MKKIVFFILSVTAIVSTFAAFYIAEEDHYYSSISPLKKFSSYEELKSFVEGSSQAYPDYYWSFPLPRLPSATFTEKILRAYTLSTFRLQEWTRRMS